MGPWLRHKSQWTLPGTFLSPIRHITQGAWLEPGREESIIADGAEWIWNIAAQHFPGALQIVDLYHAGQHLWDLVRSLYLNKEIKQKRWMLRQQADLDGGEIEKLVRSLRSLDTAFPELADQIRIESEYFQRNAARMLIRNSADSICSSAPALSRLAATPSLVSIEAVGNVLGRARSQCHHCPSAAFDSVVSPKIIGLPDRAPPKRLQKCRAPNGGCVAR